jgi:ankyrin repeat protein
MGDLETVTKLIRDGLDPNYYSEEKKKTILFMTLESGRRDVARKLLLEGANPNTANPETGDFPLFNACDTWDVEAVQLLLEFKANPSQLNEKVGISPFQSVCSRTTDKKELVELFLDYGASPESEYSDKQSVLGSAIELEDVSLVESLVRKRYRRHEVLLLFCIREYCEGSFFHKNDLPLDMFKEIMKNTQVGANLDVVTRIVKSSYTIHDVPLSLAVLKNNAEMVEVILKNGADPNKIGKSGNSVISALHFASQIGNVEIIDILVRYGADPYLLEDMQILDDICIPSCKNPGASIPF